MSGVYARRLNAVNKSMYMFKGAHTYATYVVYVYIYEQLLPHGTLQDQQMQ